MGVSSLPLDYAEAASGRLRFKPRWDTPILQVTQLPTSRRYALRQWRPGSSNTWDNLNIYDTSRGAYLEARSRRAKQGAIITCPDCTYGLLGFDELLSCDCCDYSAYEAPALSRGIAKFAEWSKTPAGCATIALALAGLAALICSLLPGGAL